MDSDGRVCPSDLLTPDERSKSENVRNLAHDIELGARLVRNGLRRDEIGLETGGVGVEELLDAFGALRL